MNVDPNKICQIEIKVGEIKKATDFYSNVFGWKPVPAYIHNYVVLGVPDGCPFGIGLIPGKSTGNRGNIILYFSVPSPDEIADLAVQWGGERLFTREVSSYGHIVQIADPDGQRFGLYSQSSAPDPNL